MKRLHDRDWIADAEAKGVVNATEACSLAELRDLVARVIAVDDFSAAELARNQASSVQAEATLSPEPEHMAAE